MSSRCRRVNEHLVYTAYAYKNVSRFHQTPSRFARARTAIDRSIWHAGAVLQAAFAADRDERLKAEGVINV
jgi:hypothetical protein